MKKCQQYDAHTMKIGTKLLIFLPPQILDSEGKQSVAVNLALGETQVVDETKRQVQQ